MHLSQTASMEAGERPAKKRKLSSDEDVMNADTSAGPAESGIETMDDGALKADSDHESSAADNDTLENQEAVAVTTATPEAPIPNLATTEVMAEQPLSKSAQKKARKKAEWESKRTERKAIRKEKQIAKRERRREERKQQHQEALDSGLIQPPPEKKSKVKLQRPVTLPVTILIDCDFDDLMRDNERISLAAQVTRSYSDNKKAMFRAHLAVCSFGGLLRERFENVLTHYKQWRGVRFLESPFVEAAEQAKGWMAEEEKESKFAGAFAGLMSANDDLDDAKAQAVSKLKEEAEIVYLTSESLDTLETLKPFSTYIIGGLVDKNREKGLCYKRAREAGVKTARLPIGEFMEMQSRKVLATNHVNEIMLKWLECGDWGEAFMKVIPKRKGGTLKGAEGQDGECEEDDRGGNSHDEDGREFEQTQMNRDDVVDDDDDIEGDTVGGGAQISVPEAA